MSNLTIGITTGIKNVEMSAGEIPCAVLNIEFIKLCNKFNAQVVIIPPQFNKPDFSLKGIDGKNVHLITPVLSRIITSTIIATGVHTCVL